ncbi:hypothetical protein B7494_g258 [Chlorociboria aeruginascens]|nr:hypothetical protein B7494_g258 [Chlorociboria aeruginascens]
MARNILLFSLLLILPPCSLSAVAEHIGGAVTLINATPYDWKLAQRHEYQMDWKFPATIPAGSAHEQWIKFLWDHGDDAAEATYAFVGAPNPQSFTLQAHQHSRRVEVQYHDGLASLNNPAGSLINLGFQDYGAISFILSGTEVPYISTNPPVAWMQSTLHTIGNKSMSEIAMLASHDSGMSQVYRSYGGVPHNTLTQTGDVLKQLELGARYLDIRPVHSNGYFYTGHFSRVMGSEMGCMGQTVRTIVRHVNEFTSRHPGELIILEISHDMDKNKHFKPMTPVIWQKLYRVLGGINDLWVPTSGDLPDDLTKVPLSRFITPGSKSAVIIRIPNGAPRPTTEIKKREIDSDSVPAADSDPSEDDMAVSTVLDSPVPSDAPPGSAPSDIDNPTDQSSSTLADGPGAIDNLPFKPEESAAFVHESRLPQTGSYSDTSKPNSLASDQIAKLKANRPSTSSLPLRSTWTITQTVGDVLNVADHYVSIIYQARYAHRKLFATLWPAMSKDTYPNLIEVDAIQDSQITALVMGINEHFVKASPGGSNIEKRTLKGFKKFINEVMDAIWEPWYKFMGLAPPDFQGKNKPHPTTSATGEPIIAMPSAKPTRTSSPTAKAKNFQTNKTATNTTVSVAVSSNAGFGNASSNDTSLKSTLQSENSNLV